MNRDNINEILNSLEGIQPARPDASLYARMEKRIAAGYTAVRTVPLSRVSLAAACILLLVVVNVLVASKHTGSSNMPSQDAAQQVADYYGLTDNMGGI